MTLLLSSSRAFLLKPLRSSRLLNSRPLSLSHGEIQSQSPLCPLLPPPPTLDPRLASRIAPISITSHSVLSTTPNLIFEAPPAASLPSPSLPSPPAITIPLPSVSTLTSAIETTLPAILSLYGYRQYSVDVHLQSLQYIQESNSESRSVDAPTDVISYPFIHYTTASSPDLAALLPWEYTLTRGQLPPPPTLINDAFNADFAYMHMNLGEIEICPDYIHHVAAWDAYAAANPDKDTPLPYEPYSDGGVSLEMSKTDCITKRTKLLLVHSVLHLLGYDHLNREEQLEMENIETWTVEELTRMGHL